MSQEKHALFSISNHHVTDSGAPLSSMVRLG